MNSPAPIEPAPRPSQEGPLAPDQKPLWLRLSTT